MAAPDLKEELLAALTTAPCGEPDGAVRLELFVGHDALRPRRLCLRLVSPRYELRQVIDAVDLDDEPIEQQLADRIRALRVMDRLNCDDVPTSIEINVSLGPMQQVIGGSLTARPVHLRGGHCCELTLNGQPVQVIDLPLARRLAEWANRNPSWEKPVVQLLQQHGFDVQMISVIGDLYPKIVVAGPPRPRKIGAVTAEVVHAQRINKTPYYDRGAILAMLGIPDTADVEIRFSTLHDEFEVWTR